MKICAIDSSGLVAGVAVSDNGICTAAYNIQYQITHSQTLLPMLDTVRERINLDLGSLDAFAVTAGPGSFTGLRIGIATVKGLSMTVDRPVVAVPTLEALAYNAYGTDMIVCPIMDARRAQVYTGIYSFDRISQGNSPESGQGSVTAHRLKVLMPQSAMSFDDLCVRLNEIGRDVMFIGDGCPVFGERMASMMKCGWECAPLHMNRQRAESLAALAQYYLESDAEERAGLGLEGVITDADGLTPVYLRESQAERVRAERNEH